MLKCWSENFHAVSFSRKIQHVEELNMFLSSVVLCTPISIQRGSDCFFVKSMFLLWCFNWFNCKMSLCPSASLKWRREDHLFAWSRWKLCLFFLISLLFYLFCMHVGSHVPWHLYRGQKTTYGGQCSPSTLWARRMQLRWADLRAGAFYQLKHLIGPLFSISNTSLCNMPPTLSV